MEMILEQGTSAQTAFNRHFSCPLLLGEKKQTGRTHVMWKQTSMQTNIRPKAEIAV